jgi:CHAT domain-containing protein/tetratricopeptide (TPR) repeat protein
MKPKQMVENSLKSLLIALVMVGCWMIPAWADDQADWMALKRQAVLRFENAQYEEAMEQAVAAFEFARLKFGENAPQVALSLKEIAGFYRELGYPEEAIPLYRDAYDIAVQAQGEAHPDTLLIGLDMATALSQEGRFDEAHPYLMAVVTQRRAQQGPDHLETLSAMTFLAQVYEARGLFADAENQLVQVISGLEQHYGPDHPEVYFNREILASVYRTQGRFEASEAEYLKVLKGKTALRGEDDPETLYTMGNLAELYRRMARYDEAESLFRQAVEGMRAVLGDEHPDRYDLMGNLGLLYQDLGRYDEAETLYRQVWEYNEATLGADHPNTLIDLNNLAGVYRAQGRYAQAEEAYLECLDRITSVLGEGHPETISIMNNLALLFENMGLYDKAEPLFKAGLKSAQSALGPTHPTTLALMNNLATLFESQGAFEHAEPLYLAVIELNREVYGDDHPNTIAAVNNLAYLYLVQAEYDKAAPHFVRVLENWREQLGDRHQNTLKALNNLARVYHQQQRYGEAETMFIEALTSRRAALGEQHPDVVRSLVDLAALFISQQRYREAEDLLQQAVTLSEAALGKHHQYTFEALAGLAELYERTGAAERALSVRTTIFERRTAFFDRVLWAAGENTRQSYIELHRPEQDRFLSLLSRVNTPDTARLALQFSLDRKGLLLKVSSEIQKVVAMADVPELSTMAETLNDKRKELSALTLSGPTTETATEFQVKIARLENEIYDLQAELGRASVLYRTASAAITTEQVFTHLEPDDVLVDFLTYEDEVTKVMAVVAQSSEVDCFAWWRCRRNRVELIQLGPLADIRNAVMIYRETIEDPDATEEDLLVTGQDAYALVWKPLEPVLGEKKSVYLVPDSALHLLPFDALIDDGEQYLIQQLDIKYLSSSRDLVVAPLPEAQGEFMIIAGPDFDLELAEHREIRTEVAGRRSAVGEGMRVAGHGMRSLSFDPLDGAELEGITIKKVADSFDQEPEAGEPVRSAPEVADDKDKASVIYVQREAEEQRLRELQDPPQRLHIATHGFFLQAEDQLRKRLLSLNRGGTLMTPPPGDNPLLRAGLAFAGINANAPFLGELDTDNDGVLTALEVLALPLAGTQLVVLSACETGVGEIHAGEGVYGLRRAFQEAGVKSVVNSLWEVSDEGTRILMTAFYTHLLEGVPTRQALKMAQLEMLDSAWEHPYYWSAFLLVERRYDANQ